MVRKDERIEDRRNCQTDNEKRVIDKQTEMDISRSQYL